MKGGDMQETQFRINKLDLQFEELNKKMENSYQQKLEDKLNDYKNKFEKLIDVVLNEKKMSDINNGQKNLNQDMQDADYFSSLNSSWPKSFVVGRNNFNSMYDLKFPTKNMSLSQDNPNFVMSDNIKKMLDGKWQSWLDIKNISNRDICASSILEVNKKDH